MQEQGGINLYAYVNGDPFGYVDPDGRFVVCRRPLSFMGNYMSPGIFDINLGIYHEHGFYEDDTGDNTGFSTGGTVDDSENKSKYQCLPEHYNDNVMREAEENVSPFWKDGYNVLTNNCQDYMDALIEEYYSLMPN